MDSSGNAVLPYQPPRRMHLRSLSDAQGSLSNWSAALPLPRGRFVSPERSRSSPTGDVIERQMMSSRMTGLFAKVTQITALLFFIVLAIHALILGIFSHFIVQFLCIGLSVILKPVSMIFSLVGRSRISKWTRGVRFFLSQFLRSCSACLRRMCRIGIRPISQVNPQKAPVVRQHVRQVSGDPEPQTPVCTVEMNLVTEPNKSNFNQNVLVDSEKVRVVCERIPDVFRLEFLFRNLNSALVLFMSTPTENQVEESQRESRTPLVDNRTRNESRRFMKSCDDMTAISMSISQIGDPSEGTPRLSPGVASKSAWSTSFEIRTQFIESCTRRFWGRKSVIHLLPWRFLLLHLWWVPYFFLVEVICWTAAFREDTQSGGGPSDSIWESTTLLPQRVLQVLWLHGGIGKIESRLMRLAIQFCRSLILLCGVCAGVSLLVFADLFVAEYYFFPGGSQLVEEQRYLPAFSKFPRGKLPQCWFGYCIESNGLFSPVENANRHCPFGERDNQGLMIGFKRVSDIRRIMALFAAEHSAFVYRIVDSLWGLGQTSITSQVFSQNLADAIEDLAGADGKKARVRCSNDSHHDCHRFESFRSILTRFQGTGDSFQGFIGGAHRSGNYNSDLYVEHDAHLRWSVLREPRMSVIQREYSREHSGTSFQKKVQLKAAGSVQVSPHPIVQKALHASVKFAPASGSETNYRVPLVIIQTNIANVLPPRMIQSTCAVLRANPQFAYEFFDDNAMNDFIRHYLTSGIVASKRHTLQLKSKKAKPASVFRDESIFMPFNNTLSEPRTSKALEHLLGTFPNARFLRNKMTAESTDDGLAVKKSAAHPFMDYIEVDATEDVFSTDRWRRTNALSMPTNKAIYEYPNIQSHNLLLRSLYNGYSTFPFNHDAANLEERETFPDLNTEEVKLTQGLIQKREHKRAQMVADKGSAERFELATHVLHPIGCAYFSLVPGAYRADLFRYLYLFMFGGVYIDMDITLPGEEMKATHDSLDLGILEALLENAESNRLMGTSVSKNLTSKMIHGNILAFLNKDDEFISAEDNDNGFVYNAFIMVRPGHPIILEALKIATQRILQRWYVPLSLVNHASLGITGPRVLGEAFLRVIRHRIKFWDGERKKEHKLFQEKDVDSDSWPYIERGQLGNRDFGNGIRLLATRRRLQCAGGVVLGKLADDFKIKHNVPDGDFFAPLFLTKYRGVSFETEKLYKGQHYYRLFWENHVYADPALSEESCYGM